MIQSERYTDDADFFYLPILALDDDMPIPTRRDYEIDSENPIAPYAPEVYVPEVIRPQISPIYRPNITPVIDDIIVPVKPQSEYNPPITNGIAINPTPDKPIKRPLEISSNVVYRKGAEYWIKGNKDGFNFDYKIIPGDGEFIEAIVEYYNRIKTTIPDDLWNYAKIGTSIQFKNGEYIMPATIANGGIVPETAKKSINPLYIVGGIVAAILVYKILK